VAAPITLRFTYTRDEILSGLRWSALESLRRRSKGIAIALVLGVAAVLALSLADQENVAATVAGIILTPITLYLVLAAYAYYVRPVKAFRDQPAYKDEVAFRFSEHGINMRGRGFNRDLRWDYYERVHEDAKRFLLVTPGLLVMIVPKRVLADAEEETRFRQLLAQKLGKH
jgi:hypothetical protein